MAWGDHFFTWRVDMGRRFATGQTVHVDLLQGAVMIETAADRAEAEERAWLLPLATAMRSATPEEGRVERATKPEISALMACYAERSGATISGPPLQVIVAPEIARFGPHRPPGGGECRA